MKAMILMSPDDKGEMIFATQSPVIWTTPSRVEKEQ